VMPANAIVAEPATLTGSIGVVMLKFVIDAPEKLGMNMEGVKNGRLRRSLLPGALRFRLKSVPRCRNRCRRPTTRLSRRPPPDATTTPERIDAIAQGRVWTGAQAKAIGRWTSWAASNARSRSPRARQAPARQRSRARRV